MADNKTTIEVSIQAAEAAKTVQELKKSLKDLVNQQANVAAGSAEWKKLTKAINDTEGKIGDLTDSFKTLQGSGVERVTSSFNLLKEGFTSFDSGKIKAAFNGIGAAMKAVPIFLIVEGITYLVSNFKELSQGSGILAKALQFVGGIIDGLVDAVYMLTDALGLTNSALEEQGEVAEENAKKVTEALAEQTAEYDRQIAVAKANGENTVELEIKKQQAILATNKTIAEQSLALIKAGKELTEDEVKRAKEAVNNIKNATAQIAVIRATEAKRIEDENKKRAEKEAEELKKRIEILNQSEIERIKSLNESLKSLNDTAKADRLKSIDDENQQVELKMSASFMRRKALSEFYDKEAANYSLNLAQMTAQNMQQISDAYFAIKMAKVQKGSAEEEKLARKQFQINKALAIQSSIISGIQGVVNALSAQSVIPEPFGTILKVANAVSVGIATAANVAKIAATQFNPSVGGGGGGGGGAVAAQVPSPPTVSTPTNNISGTQFDAQGNTITPQAQQPTITVKAQVVESDMTDTQNTVTKYKAQSTF